MLEQPKYITVQHIVTAPGLVVGVFSFPLICAPLSTLSSILLPVTQKSVSVLKDVSVPKMHLEDTRQREEEACWRSLYSRCNLCFFLPSVFKVSWSTAGIHEPNRRRTVWTKLHMYSYVIIMFKCAAFHYFLYLATFSVMNLIKGVCKYKRSHKNYYTSYQK